MIKWRIMQGPCRGGKSLKRRDPRDYNPYENLTDGELAILGGGGQLPDGRNDRDVANTPPPREEESASGSK